MNDMPATIVLPYIRQATGQGGKHRTDADDIARILLEHGAHRSAAYQELHARITTLIPPVPYPATWVRELEARLSELAHAGYGVEEMRGKAPARAGRQALGGAWEEVREIDRELEALHQETNAWARHTPERGQKGSRRRTPMCDHQIARQ